MKKFCLGWHSGTGAQFELFSPPNAQVGDYQMKYTPPFRTTIRPLINQRLFPGDLDPESERLKQILAELSLGTRGVGGNALTAAERATLARDLQTQGQKLWDLALPKMVQPDLRRRERLFLDLGFDEQLLDHPWELMHDGSEEEHGGFLCLKHFVGRFVNAGNMPEAPQPLDVPAHEVERLRILVISVPRPQQRATRIYDPLTAGDAETDKINEIFSSLGTDLQVAYLLNQDATYDKVYTHLKNCYEIIHFIGHAHYDAKQPYASSLVLHDRDMYTSALMKFFGKNPPVLLFMNACDTGKAVNQTTGSDPVQYHLFSLARAFLETGAYLLGSRWKLSDKAAAVFAPAFYRYLIAEAKSIGESILLARLETKRSTDPDDIGWASYIYYGDPRLCLASPAAPPGSSPSPLPGAAAPSTAPSSPAAPVIRI